MPPPPTDVLILDILSKLLSTVAKDIHLLQVLVCGPRRAQHDNLKVFVSNRVNNIVSLIPAAQWDYWSLLVSDRIDKTL